MVSEGKRVKDVMGKRRERADKSRVCEYGVRSDGARAV